MHGPDSPLELVGRTNIEAQLIHILGRTGSDLGSQLGKRKIISWTFFFVTKVSDDLEMGWEPGDLAAGDDK